LAIDRVNLELTNPHSVAAVVENASPDVIVHTAAMTSTADCQNYRDLADDVNVGGTRHLLRAAGELGQPAHFILISTDLVFSGDKGALYNETDSPAPRQHYGQTKLESEHAVSMPSYPGLATILRSALIIAPPNGPRPGMLDWTIDSIRQGRGTFFADEYRTPVFVEDVCRAIDRAARDSIGGLFHIGGCDRVSRAAMAREVAKAFRLPESNLRTSTRAEAGPEIAALRPADVSMDIGRAVSILGHAPDPLETTLQRMARFSAV
jgi:dTDP-4-dehydrorhamnose reductase